MSDMAQIPLSGGKVAIIDAADLPLVSGRKWHAARRAINRENWYASTAGRDGEPSTLYMHRLLLGAQPGQLVDHRNGDGLDNRRSSNLRLATPVGNAANSVLEPGQSGYRGVWPKRGRFVAQIQIDGTRHRLGGFATAIEAALAYDEAAMLLFADFAALNFPDPEDRRRIAASVTPTFSRPRRISWSSHEIEILTALSQSGASHDEMALRLGRSAKACQEKAIRLRTAALPKRAAA